MTADAERLLALNRGRRSIEAMYRVLNEPTGCNEDHSRIKSGYGPKNMTCLRRFAIRLIRAILPHLL